LGRYIATVIVFHVTGTLQILQMGQRLVLRQWRLRA
jgi:hypothetical protein